MASVVCDASDQRVQIDNNAREPDVKRVVLNRKYSVSVAMNALAQPRQSCKAPPLTCTWHGVISEEAPDAGDGERAAAGWVSICLSEHALCRVFIRPRYRSNQLEPRFFDLSS